jgi:hypothetical protein
MSHYWMLDDESFNDEYDESVALLYSADISYQRKFMEKKDAEDKFENIHHWMDLNFVVPLFCLTYGVRVVVYQIYGHGWNTSIFDNRESSKSDADAPMHVQFLPGLVAVTGREHSFGLYYDGEHYEYLTLPV